MTKNNQDNIQKRSELVTQIESCKKQLNWDSKDEMDYVKKHFGKLSRAFLTLDELQEYLNHLSSQTDVELEKECQMNLFDL